MKSNIHTITEANFTGDLHYRPTPNTHLAFTVPLSTTPLFCSHMRAGCPDSWWIEEQGEATRPLKQRFSKVTLQI